MADTVLTLWEWSPGAVLAQLRRYSFFTNAPFGSPNPDYSQTLTATMADWEGYHAAKFEHQVFGPFGLAETWTIWVILAWIPFGTLAPPRTFLTEPGWSSAWYTGPLIDFDEEDISPARLDLYFGIREQLVTEVTGASLVSFDSYSRAIAGGDNMRETAVEVWDADNEHLVSVDSRVHISTSAPVGAPTGSEVIGLPEQLPFGAVISFDVSQIVKPLKDIAGREVVFSFGDFGPWIHIHGKAKTE